MSSKIASSMEMTSLGSGLDFRSGRGNISWVFLRRLIV